MSSASHVRLVNMPAAITLALERAVRDAGLVLDTHSDYKNSFPNNSQNNSQIVSLYCLDASTQNAADIQAAANDLANASTPTVLLVMGADAASQAYELTLPLEWSVLDWPSSSASLRLAVKRAQQQVSAAAAIAANRDEQLADARTLLSDSLEAGRMYCWQWNLLDNSRRTIGPSGSILGMTASSGEQAQALIYPDDLAQDEALLQRAIAEHSIYQNEFRIIRPDGELRWIFSRGNVNYDSHGKAIYLSGVAVDVSDRRRTEQKLTDAARSLNLALDAAKLNPWRIDLVGNAHSSGPLVAELFGEKITSIEHFRSFVVPEDRALLASLREPDFLTSGEARRFEFRVRQQNGKLVWLACHAQGVCDESGRPLQIVGVTYDVSEARQAQEKLARSLTQLDRVQSATNVTLWEWSRSAGARCYQLGGLELSGLELPGIHPDDQPRVLRRLLQCASSGETFDEEFRLANRLDQYGWVAVQGRRTSLEKNSESAVLSGVMLDITARKKSAHLLSVTEDRLRRALDAAKMVNWEWRLGEAVNIHESPSNYTPSIASNKSNGSVVHPEDRERHQKAIRDAMASISEDYRCEFRMLHPDGSVTWLLSIGSRLCDEHGAAIGLVGVAIDISIQKNIEDELAESQEWQNMAVTAGELNLWRVDIATGERFGGALDEKLFGFTPGSIAEVEVLIHPDDQTRVDVAWLECIASKTTYDIDYRIVLPSGNVRWLRVRGKCKQDPITGAKQMVGATTDITAQKELEDALEESREWQRLAIAAGKLNLWRIDAVTGVRVGGDLDQGLFGLSPANLQQFEDMIHPDDREQEKSEWQRSVELGIPYAIDHRIIHVDGSIRWLRVRGERLKAGRNANPQMVGASLDITDQINAQFELQNALRAARQASEAKSSFLASVSHELRTPLNAVIGFSSLLMSTELDGTQHSHVQALNSSAQQLYGLINDVLDYSRIEAGEMHIEKTPFNLLSDLESTLDMVSGAADEKGLCLFMTHRGDVHRAVIGDPLRLRQIIANLLSNAVKFTERGMVCLELEALAVDEHLEVSMRVRDTGVGMSEAVTAQLFQAFRQGDVSTTRRFGGTGLGLSISKRLVELMQGSIVVDSAPDQGSCFEVKLSLALAADAVEKPRLLGGQRIGIAVGCKFMREGLLGQLQEFAATTDLLDTTKLLEQFCDARMLDAIVVDMPMVDILRDIVAWPRRRDGRPVPAVVLVGIDQALKPWSGPHGETYVPIARAIKPRQLYRALSELPQLDVSSKHVKLELGDFADLTGKQGFELPRILVVEDNEINQTLLLLQLESLGLSAMLANNGQEALQALSSQTYDIVLMDVEMPIMDGIEAATHIRNDAKFQKHSPYIIAITAHVLGDSRARFLAAGMDDFISKPVIMSSLSAALERAFAVISTEPDSRSKLDRE